MAGRAECRSAPKPVARPFGSRPSRVCWRPADSMRSACAQTVQELGESDAPLVLAGASVVHTNSLEAMVASHYLNLMLGNVGKPGGVLPPAARSSLSGIDASCEALAHAQAVILAGANPVYTMPRSGGAADALARAETVISFGTFWTTPPPAPTSSCRTTTRSNPNWPPCRRSPRPAVAVSTPFVDPLYDTRAVETTLADIADKIGAKYEARDAQGYVSPAEGSQFRRCRARWRHLAGRHRRPGRRGPMPLRPDWRRPASKAILPNIRTLSRLTPPCNFTTARGSHLPWLQELPDPASSSIWGLPVEIDPQDRAAFANLERRRGAGGIAARCARSARLRPPRRHPRRGEHGPGRWARTNPVVSILAPSRRSCAGHRRAAHRRDAGETGARGDRGAIGFSSPRRTAKKGASITANGTPLGNGHRSGPLHGLRGLRGGLPRRK